MLYVIRLYKDAAKLVYFFELCKKNRFGGRFFGVEGKM